LLLWLQNNHNKICNQFLLEAVKDCKLNKMGNISSAEGIFLVLLFVLVLLTIFGIAYLYITSKNKERMALIERGMDPNLAKSDFLTQIGIIGGGAALGLITADIMPGKYGPLVAILFAGAGLVMYNIIVKGKARRNR
jgi:hypothetical protein